MRARALRIAAVLAVAVTGSAVHGTAFAKGAGASPGAGHRRVDQDDDEKQKRKTAWLKGVGGELSAKDAAGLVARVPKGRKLRLAGLGDKNDTYEKDTARNVLTNWFKEYASIKAKLTKVAKDVGSFDLTVRRTGKDEEKTISVLVTIAVSSDGSFFLVAIERA